MVNLFLIHSELIDLTNRKKTHTTLLFDAAYSNRWCPEGGSNSHSLTRTGF